MSRDDRSTETRARSGESFLQRFSRRKSEARVHDAAVPATIDPDAPDAIDQNRMAGEPGAALDPPQRPTDADMPPVESLTADSDFSGFLSEKVSESLRRAALRKLFHSANFNIIDELDDYAEDFTAFEALGDIVTADMRHRLEVEARREAEALAERERQTVDPQNADPEIVNAETVGQEAVDPQGVNPEHLDPAGPDPEGVDPATAGPPAEPPTTHDAPPDVAHPRRETQST